MQAPKLTLENAQDATLRVCNRQFFVTRVDVSWDGKQVRSLPINTPIETGVVLSVQPLVAADRQSLQLHFQAELTSLESQKVGLAPVMTQIQPVHESGEKVEPVTFTQFIQTPKVVTISADKVLAIPEGQTAVLSGWKHRREVTRKWALPILSELPYLGCLYSYEWQEPVWERVLFLVTPRVVLSDRIHSGIEGLLDQDSSFPGGGGLPLSGVRPAPPLRLVALSSATDRLPQPRGLLPICSIRVSPTQEDTDAIHPSPPAVPRGRPRGSHRQDDNADPP